MEISWENFYVDIGVERFNISLFTMFFLWIENSKRSGLSLG